MKNTFFFSHDFGARNDPKLQNLLMEHGCEGIGVYWCMIEQMYEQGGQLPLSSCKSIAYTLHVSCELVSSVINDFLLFDNDGETFWSESVKLRLNKRVEISEKRREAGKKGWQKTFNNEQMSSNHTANVRQMPSNDEANAEQAKSKCPAIKGKEIKEKEIKENENKENNNIDRESKKAIQEKEPQIDLSYINPDFVPKWKRWIAYRKEIKKPLQAMSLKSAYEKLLKMAGGDYITAESIIEQSIANGWQGLFELKTQKDNNGNINTAIANFGFATANENANRKGGFYSGRDDAANRRAEVASLKRAAEAILSEPNPEKVFAGMAK